MINSTLRSSSTDRKRRRTLRGLSAALAGALALAACGSHPSSTSPSSGSASSAATTGTSASAKNAGRSGGTIGFLSYWAGGDPFAVALTNAALAEGKKLGVTVDYVNGNNDLSTQIAAVQTFITKKVKAIVVFPGNTTSLIPILNKAAAAGIPVVDLNQKLASTAKTTIYVGDNDYTYGEDEAKLLVKALGGKGTFALAQGIIGSAPQIDRTAGIKHVLLSYPGIKMVATQSDNWSSSQLLALTQDWTTKYPNLNAIVAEGPEAATGAQWAAAHGHKNIKFIAGDYPTYVQTAIQKGEVYGTVDQSPILEAQDAMIAAYDIESGKSSKLPKPNWFVPLPLVTKANVNQIKPAW